MFCTFFCKVSLTAVGMMDWYGYLPRSREIYQEAKVAIYELREPIGCIELTVDNVYK